MWGREVVVPREPVVVLSVLRRTVGVLGGGEAESPILGGTVDGPGVCSRVRGDSPVSSCVLGSKVVRGG